MIAEEHRPLGLKLIGALMIISGLVGVLFVFLFSGRIYLEYRTNIRAVALIMSIFHLWLGNIFLSLRKYAWYIVIVYCFFGVVGFVWLLLTHRDQINTLPFVLKLALFTAIFLNIGILGYVFAIKQYFNGRRVV